MKALKERPPLNKCDAIDVQFYYFEKYPFTHPFAE